MRPIRKTPLTEAQQKVFAAIKLLVVRERGLSPTVAELAQETGLSEGTVHASVGVLDARGLISRRPNTARSIQVLKGEVPQEARA